MGTPFDELQERTKYARIWMRISARGYIFLRKVLRTKDRFRKKVCKLWRRKAYVVYGELKPMKTEETDKLERALHIYAKKYRQIGCNEVTIGWFGKERVDYLAFNTRGVWLCYEIKVTKADFRSKAAKTFVGNKNYYAMPMELYKEVADEIPNHIGVLVSQNGSQLYCDKNAKSVKISVPEKTLWQSLLRSLCRGYDAHWDEKDGSKAEWLKGELKRAFEQMKMYKEYETELYHKMRAMKSLLRERGITTEDIDNRLAEMESGEYYRKSKENENER
jgi:hypothetical protein